MNRRTPALIVLVLCTLVPSAATVRASDLTTSLPTGISRPWIGPEFFANRLQDWHLAESARIECREDGERLPLRTLHVPTRSLGAEPGAFEMTVRTGMIDPGDGSSESWVGFLIGAGGDHVDYRLTALVHHRPAEDGGLLAVMDRSGRVMFRDNSQGGGGGLWSIGGPLDPADVPELPADTMTGPGFGEDENDRAVVLYLRGEPGAEGYRLTMSARRVADGSLVGRAIVEGVDAALVDGGVALVAHRTRQWFDDWHLTGEKVLEHPDRSFGPIVSAMHTLSDGVLTMTAQMAPLGKRDRRTARLDVHDATTRNWRTIQESDVLDPSCTVRFRVGGWDGSRDVPYRVVYDEIVGADDLRRHEYHGTIRAEPREKDSFDIAVFTGHKCFTGGLKWNHGGIWFPHPELVEAVAAHEPDFLFFSGDQVYEGDLTPAQFNPPEQAMLDYLYKWYRWCWAFRDLAREIPCVTIPDDHDVYHGNIWGAGGKKAVANPERGITAQDSGGYKMPAWFVNAVHRTQTSHLPAPYDPAPVEQGISVYSTTIDYAGVSFAVVADRQWKSAPTPLLPEGRVVNGWYRNPDFDPRTQADHPDAVLLGRRQLEMLDDWGRDWSGGTWMKVLLSQSPFANVATIPADAMDGSVIPGMPIPEPGGYLEGHKFAADMDSNGWPRSGRNRAVAALRRAFAIHLAGDQHLGALMEYGIDEFRDGGYAFSAPSIANTWPRRWYPPEPGANRAEGSPRYTGDFIDGFGNPVTVYAVSNPEQVGIEPTRLNHAAPGYGIVRLDRATRRITFECWPRWVDPALPGAGTLQYRGWPVTADQYENFGGPDARWSLPELRFADAADPIVQVIDERTDEVVFTVRARGDRFQPRVLHEGIYRVRIDPDDGRPVTVIESLEATRSADPGSVPVGFDPDQ